MAPQNEPLLSVRGLTVKFDDFVAVDELSFDLFPGQTLAIVGESGSGKSVTALSIMRLVELGTRAKITQGEIIFRRPDGSTMDLVQASERDMRTMRGNNVSMIFQEPLTSLNPVYTTGNQVAEAVRIHHGIDKSAGDGPGSRDVPAGADSRTRRSACASIRTRCLAGCVSA